jgi:hypothetical protein
MGVWHRVSHARRKDANYVERMQKRSREDEPTRRAEPYYPPAIRKDLIFLEQTVGESCSELCDLSRKSITGEFALIRERLRGVACDGPTTKQDR